MKKALLLAGLLSFIGLFSLGAVADEEEDDFLDSVQAYLAVSEKFVDLANRREAAVFFAVEGIAEIHEERGELAKAAPHLIRILEQHPDNQTVRNIVHFKLRDIYRETGRSDLALQQLEAVIRENR